MCTFDDPESELNIWFVAECRIAGQWHSSVNMAVIQNLIWMQSAKSKSLRVAVFQNNFISLVMSNKNRGNDSGEDSRRHCSPRSVLHMSHHVRENGWTLRSFLACESTWASCSHWWALNSLCLCHCCHCLFEFHHVVPRSPLLPQLPSLVPFLWSWTFPSASPLICTNLLLYARSLLFSPSVLPGLLPLIFSPTSPTSLLPFLLPLNTLPSVAALVILWFTSESDRGHQLDTWVH